MKRRCSHLLCLVSIFPPAAFKSNQIKFNKQQRAKSHLQVAKTLIKTINIFQIIRTEENRGGITRNKPYKV